MKMKDLPADDRPREKLFRCGARNLSASELIAIIIGSGTKTVNASDLARNILSDCSGSLSVLMGRSAEDLSGTVGIGKVKAASLLAAMELGRRAMLEKAGPEKAMVSASRVFEHMYPRLKSLDHEQMYALFLNRLLNLRSCDLLSEGGASATSADPSVVVRRALELKASKVVIVHNHPSGDPSPSQSDINWTIAIQKALGSVGLSLTDHVIVSDNGYYSFAENTCNKPKKAP